MSERIRTALSGGTFNPIHNGHLAIAQSILEKGLADCVWLMVTPCNPWKSEMSLLPDTLRLEMVSQAASTIPGVLASDFEFSLPKPSYTADTLRRLTACYPDREFILTIGGDNWELFHDWKDWQYILENFHIIVYPRSGYSIGHVPHNVTILDCPLFDISSTQIRQMVRNGQDITELVPESTSRTISELGLYKD